MTRNTLEILTGGVALVVLVAVFAFSYTSDRLARTVGYDLIARFQRVDGLATGSMVRLAGIEVGEVKSQRFDPATRQAVVTFRINSGVQIPIDSAAMIISQGILGSKFVRIEPGGEETYLEDGDEFDFVQNSVILEDVLERLIKEVETTRENKQSGTTSE
ncbi:MAG: MlaD family protein [Alphaproteobacteria bacterium]|nr:MlaD family protein [Alphaproteobacteria bacterium]